MSFQLSILTPSGKAFEGQVDSVAAIGTDGGYEVYTGHAPMITSLKPGRARVRQSGKETAFEITSGVLEVTPEHNVLLLADQATPVG